MKGRSIITLCMLAFVFGLTEARAQSSAEQVKTLFVFNFTRYIQWPQNSNEILIGVLGSDKDILKAFEEMAAKKSTGSIKIHVKQFTNPAEASNYQMVYVTEKSSDAISQLKNLSNTLVITEKPGYAKKGSDVNFITEEGKIRFEMNKAKVENAGFKVSGKLMALAILV